MIRLFTHCFVVGCLPKTPMLYISTYATSICSWVPVHKEDKDCQFAEKASVMSNLLAVTLVAMAAFYSCCLPMASAGCFRGDYSGECTQHKEIQYWGCKVCYWRGQNLAYLVGISFDVLEKQFCAA